MPATRRALPLLLLASALHAQTAAPLLVPNEWLAAHLNDPSLVLLHIGSAKDYQAGHIPGARLLTLSDISVNGAGDLRLELPPVAALKQAFAKLGVTSTSRIVLYAGNDVLQSATRVWFTLDYLGLSTRSSLLNGPFKLWKSEGRAVTTEAPPAAQPGQVTAAPDPSRVVSADWIYDHLKDPAITIIDARTPEFYSGTSDGGMPRAGHIPGAVNLTFSSLLDDQGRFLPMAQLRAAFTSRHIQSAVAYCHIGQQATLVYFAARLLGLDVRLYDGSFQDWSRRAELPVESSPALQ